MGCCQAESVINTPKPSLSRAGTLIPYYGNEKFEDFPEWNGERYSGI